ncbi:MAG: hypothetical protein FJW27_06145 [Acidimicrobiia bacterium]|nr:hypothetical protein [Acidimicrobiia bacterium]
MVSARSAAVTLVTTGAVAALVSTLAGQGRPSSPQPTRQAPAARTPWGTPDLHGTWSFATVTRLERPEGVTKEYYTAEEIAAIEKKALDEATDEARGATAQQDVAGAYNDFWWDRGTRVSGRRTGLIVDPPTGRMPPLTPAAQKFADSKEAADIQARRNGDLPPAGPEDTDLWDRCLTRGIPIVPGPYNNNIEIFQTPTHVVIHHEMIHDARVAPIVPAGAKRPAVPNDFKPWFGVSQASWQGDTLVVETTNISDRQELPFSPRMSAGTMKLTEKFTRTPHGTLRYEFTVDDPTIYTRPWTAVLEMPPSDGAVFEYACHEGNHAMESILRGARQRDPGTYRPVQTTTLR